MSSTLEQGIKNNEVSEFKPALVASDLQADQQVQQEGPRVDETIRSQALADEESSRRIAEQLASGKSLNELDLTSHLETVPIASQKPEALDSSQKAA